jgi:hypothetical protein
MTQNAIAFSASFSWAGIAACGSSQPSFRGAAEGREPGIHNLGRWLWIPG